MLFEALLIKLSLYEIYIASPVQNPDETLVSLLCNSCLFTL